MVSFPIPSWSLPAIINSLVYGVSVFLSPAATAATYDHNYDAYEQYNDKASNANNDGYVTVFSNIIYKAKKFISQRQGE